MRDSPSSLGSDVRSGGCPQRSLAIAVSSGWPRFTSPVEGGISLDCLDGVGTRNNPKPRVLKAGDPRLSSHTRVLMVTKLSTGTVASTVTKTVGCFK